MDILTGLLYEARFEDYHAFNIASVRWVEPDRWIEILATPNQGVSRRLALPIESARALVVALLAMVGEESDGP